ncbi:MAG: hypothetical protein KIT34_04970 [Cyanobacteria bacterium TGS_CYA1]|nr:hypothetical protein [Cyanobacteria bacterium TGS_CYA1]
MGQLKSFVLVSLLLALNIISVATPTFAMKRAANMPMVISGLDGRFYARCVPAKEDGSAGSTKIYRVESTKDILLDSYDFYPQHGIWLGWSPKAGKVALMARLVEQNVDPNKQVELTFYLGGKKLNSYTSAQLWKMGAQKKLDMIGGNCAEISVRGCEQVPGTNDYDFVVRTGLKTVLRFDILTGKAKGCALPDTGVHENIKF